MIRAVVLLPAGLLLAAAAAHAQDSVPAAPALPAHQLGIDTTLVMPYTRVYDMLVTTEDSSVTIGERAVMLQVTTYNADTAWLLTETRTGIVPSTDSLYLSRTLRPLHWSSVVGLSHLGVEITADSIYGAAVGPTGRQNIVLAARPDLLTSGAMTEVVLGALPLALGYRDSVTVLEATLTTASVIPGELGVIGEEDIAEGQDTRACWVVAVRADVQQVLYWVEKGSGVVIRSQQLLPLHDGDRLDFVLRPDSVPSPADSLGTP